MHHRHIVHPTCSSSPQFFRLRVAEDAVRNVVLLTAWTCFQLCQDFRRTRPRITVVKNMKNAAGPPSYSPTAVALDGLFTSGFLHHRGAVAVFVGRASVNTRTPQDVFHVFTLMFSIDKENVDLSERKNVTSEQATPATCGIMLCPMRVSPGPLQGHFRRPHSSRHCHSRYLEGRSASSPIWMRKWPRHSSQMPKTRPHVLVCRWRARVSRQGHVRRHRRT